ncbi:MAG: hypothetical protein GXP33_11200 [Spirochaetes bacterium]|nr:hypothetical protein [Spirochaetota bacterium]
MSKRYTLPVFIIVIFMFIPAVCSFAQAKGKEVTPSPYEKNEFPVWMHDLRRGEIILIGSFPLSMFFSYEFYDFYRYFSNNLDPSYRPWPFRTYDAVPYNSMEKVGIVLSALSVSFVVAVTDYLIGRIFKKKNRPENDEKQKKLYN